MVMTPASVIPISKVRKIRNVQVLDGYFPSGPMARASASARVCVMAEAWPVLGPVTRPVPVLRSVPGPIPGQVLGPGPGLLPVPVLT